VTPSYFVNLQQLFITMRRRIPEQERLLVTFLLVLVLLYFLLETTVGSNT
jgi:hypothetical protein